MHKRSNTLSRVTRQVPENTFTQTIFGTKVPTTFECKCCAGTFLVGESYLESKSKRKHDDQIRGICVSCWDSYNGRIYEKPDPSKLVDIMTFVKE